MSSFDADDLDQLIQNYEKKYEGRIKGCQILKAIREQWAPSKLSINRDVIIREVWQAELKGLKGSALGAKMQKLRGRFRVQMAHIRDHLQELRQSGDNPMRIGLVKNTFAVVASTEVRKTLEDYARERESPWLIKEIEIQVTLNDAQGRIAEVSREMVVVPLKPGLKDYTYITGSDGSEHSFEVTPGWVAERYSESGDTIVVQGFRDELPKDQPQKLTLRYITEQSYMNKRESFRFRIHYPTAREKLIINFPPDRPCTFFDGFRLIGQHEVKERGPYLNPDRTRLEWEIINPPHNEEYRLVWKW